MCVATCYHKRIRAYQIFWELLLAHDESLSGCNHYAILLPNVRGNGIVLARSQHYIINMITFYSKRANLWLGSAKTENSDYYSFGLTPHDFLKSYQPCAGNWANVGHPSVNLKSSSIRFYLIRATHQHSFMAICFQTNQLKMRKNIGLPVFKVVIT